LVDLLALDASVVVKWFKEGEEHEEEALALRDKILELKVSAVSSEWLLLEVARAMVRAGFPREKVEGAYSALREMASLGFMELVGVGDVLDGAKEAIVELSLYASDAVYLATAVHAGASLVAEDRHLLGSAVREYAGRGGVRVFSLGEMT